MKIYRRTLRVITSNHAGFRKKDEHLINFVSPTDLSRSSSHRTHRKRINRNAKYLQFHHFVGFGVHKVDSVCGSTSDQISL